MDAYSEVIQIVGLTMGVAWASGINLYAALLMLGIGGSTGHIDLPDPLLVLEDPFVIGAAAFMYATEFFADKVPGVDTGWDAIHTFIRIPAGALLASGAVGDVSPALIVASGILGGSVTAVSHSTKAGSRLLINASPEPFSNWAASVSEDIVVVAGLWTALNYPIVFIVCLILFLVLMSWLLPKLWRVIKALLIKINSFFDSRRAQERPAKRLPTALRD